MEQYPDDILYNILLNVNMDKISQMCILNKSANNICNNNNFWVDKFTYDNILLPNLFPNNISGWIKEYKIADATSRAINFIQLILKNILVNEDMTLIIDFDDSQILQLLHILNQIIDYKTFESIQRTILPYINVIDMVTIYIFVVQTIDGPYIKYSIANNINSSIDGKITTDNFLSLLTNIIYL